MKKEKSFFLDILSTVTKFFLIFVCILMAYLMCSGIRVVKSGNVAIILRFGKLVGETREEQIHQPGLLLAFPNFIDEVIIIPSNNVMEQTVDTHYTGPGGLTGYDGGYLITGDQNIAVVSASVKYVVSDPVFYATHVKEIEKIIDATVSSAMLNNSARMAVDDLLTSKKDEFSQSIKDFSMEKINKLDLGVSITSLELTNVSMPNEIKFIYDEVNSATVKAETIIEQAKLNSQQQMAAARAKYDIIVSNAKEEASRLNGEATKEMAEFWGYVKQYEAAPDLVTKRVFAEKVTQAINKIKEVRIVEGDGPIIIS